MGTAFARVQGHGLPQLLVPGCGQRRDQGWVIGWKRDPTVVVAWPLKSRDPHSCGRSALRLLPGEGLLKTV